MGVTDVHLGYGFKVSKWDYDFSQHPEYNKEEHPDLYNFLYETIEDRFDLLEVDTERYGSDVTGHGAVFIRSSTVNWYGVETRDIENLSTRTDDEERQLVQASIFLGLIYQPGYIAVTSFG